MSEDDIKLEAKALFDRLFAWQQSMDKPDKDVFIFRGTCPEQVTPNRALALAKDWVNNMDRDIANKDLPLAYFDMKCALYWLRYVVGTFRP